MTENLSKLEEEYNKDLEKNLEAGIQNPILLHWFKKDPVGELEVADSLNIKTRYKVCKECINFDKVFKMCKKCNCFMPIKTQFKIFSCPIGKW